MTATADRPAPPTADGLTRREFLTLLSTLGVVGGSSGWLATRLLAMVEEGAVPAPRGPGIESWVPTLCRLCPAGCGIRVRLVDGLPVGLEGNPTNPMSAGGLCPAGLAGLQVLVHPDRVRTPLRRAGARGAGRWTAIGWDEALDEMARALRRLRAEGRPQSFMVLERGDSALTRFWLERVLRAFGSPNLVVGDTLECWRSAWAYVAGAAEPPAPDLPRSDFILSLGHELFETDGHPVWQSKVWGRLRAPTEAAGVALAYVGPRLSPTATRADLRVAIHPGTEATLALGLIHVLIMEDLVDRSFLALWTRGYGERAAGSGADGAGFERFIRRHYVPEEVSRVTGVPVSEIFRLGRAFGRARRPVALAGPGALSGEDGLATAMAVVALNLTVGSVGRAGGYVASGRAPFDLPDELEPDAVARRGLAAPRIDAAGEATLPPVEQSPARLAAALAAGEPYPVEAVLVHGVNPIHEWPQGEVFERALEEVDLVVVMGVLADETARMADLILPEASYLEAWQILPSPAGAAIDYAGLQQPVLPPLYQSRAFEEMWLELARRVGGSVASVVPEGSYAEWLSGAAGGLFRAHRGTIAGDVFQERIATFMQTRGWKVPGPGTPEAFWEGFRRSGSWVDVAASERSPEEVLGPGVTRFEFWPARLHRDLERLAGESLSEVVIYGEGPGSGSGRTNPSTDGYPLRLLLFDTNTLWAGRTAAIPLMLEMSGFREDLSWESWAEIHPATARRSRIESGDRVRIESPAGSLTVRARLSAAVPQDAVAIPRGLGHRHFGRFATGVGVNPMALVPTVLDRATGAAVLAAQVRLAPA